MAFSIFDAADVQKLMKKRRIAARMIASCMDSQLRAWDHYYKRSQELIKCEKKCDEYNNRCGKYAIDILLKDKRISDLEHEIKELKEEIDLNNLENAHLEGKIAAYEKILKIEK